MLWPCLPNLFLHQLKLFCFKEFLGYTLGAGLSTEQQIPQVFAKGRSILVQKSGELYLE
jgi:hypothetical protein